MSTSLTTHLLPDGSLGIRVGDADLATAVAYVSTIDGALVVEIDTSNSGHLRVIVNDGIIFDTDPALGNHQDTVAGYALEVVAALGDQIAL